MEVRVLEPWAIDGEYPAESRPWALWSDADHPSCGDELPLPESFDLVVEIEAHYRYPREYCLFGALPNGLPGAVEWQDQESAPLESLPYVDGLYAYGESIALVSQGSTTLAGSCFGTYSIVIEPLYIEGSEYGDLYDP
ncbi:MAG: hypothetical protein H5U40_08790, partial [Polyangiaceae bacterium]|nr:hypothetical protein [Polyangiaceae bacterium]